MHYSALVYDLYALNCCHAPKMILLLLFLMLHQTIEQIQLNSINFILFLFSSIQRQTHIADIIRWCERAV